MTVREWKGLVEIRSSYDILLWPILCLSSPPPMQSYSGAIVEGRHRVS